MSYAGRGVGVTVNLGVAGADDGSAEDGAAGSRDTISTTDVEHVIGSAARDVLNGNSLGFPLTLEGRDSGDSLTGGNGPNTLRGDQGNGPLTGDDDPDLLEGGHGADSMNGLGAPDVLRAGSGFDSIKARDAIADDVDCGPDLASALTDAVDTRTNCDPAPSNTGGGAAGGPGAGPARRIHYHLPGTAHPRQAHHQRVVWPPLDRLRRVMAHGVPRGSRFTVTCKTKGRKRCARTRNFRKSNARGNVGLRSFERKPLPVDAKLEIRATRPGAIGAVGS